ncbi:MAG: EAL and HDOD domain-containing protein [Actinomycetota bacterium]
MSQPAQQAEVVIQHAPVVDSYHATHLYLLTFYADEYPSQSCRRELSSLARPLAQAHRRFLVHFVGLKNLEGARPSALPPNVEILDPGAFTADGFWYRGRKLSSWWEFAKSYEVPAKRELAPTEATVIRALNLIRRNEDVSAISHTVKQDPGLVHGLLRYLNSAKMFFENAYGGFRSIEQAIMFMGYRQFAKWLSMYLLHASVEGRMPVLYLTSIVRARLMEILAKPAGFHPSRQDAIFITGIFSLLDKITGMPMEAVLQSLELDAPVRQALLEGEGEYTPLLELACATESGSLAELSSRMAALELSAHQLNLALVEAIQFATDFD